MRITTLLLLLATLAYGQVTAKVDKVFERFNRGDSPGCALAVVRDGRIVYERGYGMADLDHDIPITPSTVFHVASMSKQFTATAIVLLAREGRLSLDDPVRKYVPEVPDFGVPITLRHLIHHTSGLRDQWELLEMAGWRYSLDLITDDDVLDLVSRQKDLNFKPGEKFLYCNTGYTLLAQVVKRVSGKSLREFTAERIFKPLNMTSTHFRDDHAEIVKRQAYGYVPDKGTFRLSVTNFDTVGATSLLTTVEDLAAWDRNFYDQRVGGAAWLAQMLERGKLNNGETINYAFGLEHGRYRGLATVSHAGSDAGYRSDMVRFPSERFTVICLANSGSANPAQLNLRVADIYLADVLKEPEKPAPRPRAFRLPQASIPVPAVELAAFAGTYQSDEIELLYHVVVEDGKLVLKRLKAKPMALVPVGHDEFRLPIGRSTSLRFVRGPGGKVTGMLFSSGRITNFRFSRMSASAAPTR